MSAFAGLMGSLVGLIGIFGSMMGADEMVTIRVLLTSCVVLLSAIAYHLIVERQ